MTDTLFEVVFQGRLVDGFSAGDVKANVARLFKATPQQVEQMFSGKRVVIRNQLDQETALKYQVLLRKNGALSTVEAMRPAEAAEPQAPAAAQPAPAAASPMASSPAPASKPNPFLDREQVPRAPASETGRLPVAGKRVESILSGVNLTLDPVGVTLSSGDQTPPALVPDISHLSIAPVGVQLSEQRELPPPIVPDVAHLSVAPPGTRLSDPDPDE